MTAAPRYAHRTEAGRALAHLLSLYAGRDDVEVLALPRGGVPVAVPVAQALGASLELLIVRKLGLPDHPEVAMGAIADLGGTVEFIRNEGVIAAAGVSEEDIDAVFALELAELRRRDSEYREGRPVVPLRDRVVIIVDDGLATGATARVAVAAVRKQHPSRVVVAVPIGAKEACAELREVADEVFCPFTPDDFHAVSQGYADFQPTEDAEVMAALRALSEFDPDPQVSMP
jgi:predicted phosphoribosyltransferase